MKKSPKDIREMLAQLDAALTLAREQGDKIWETNIILKRDQLMCELYGVTLGEGDPYDLLPKQISVPAIHPTNNQRVAVIKLFHPASGWTWYILEADRRRREAFGLVVGAEVELGYFSLDELASIGPIRVERDLWFSPTPLEEIPEYREFLGKASDQKGEQTQCPKTRAEIVGALGVIRSRMEEIERLIALGLEAENFRDEIERLKEQEKHYLRLLSRGLEPVDSPSAYILFCDEQNGWFVWTGDTAHATRDTMKSTLSLLLGVMRMVRSGFSPIAAEKGLGGEIRVYVPGNALPYGVSKLVVQVGGFDHEEMLDWIIRHSYAEPDAVIPHVDGYGAYQTDTYIRTQLYHAQVWALGGNLANKEERMQDPQVVLRTLEGLDYQYPAPLPPTWEPLSRLLWSPETFLEQVGFDKGVIEKLFLLKQSEQSGAEAEQPKAESRRKGAEAEQPKAESRRKGAEAEQPKAESRRHKFRAGPVELTRGQAIQVQVGWAWKDATVHSVSGRYLIYQIGDKRGKTPVAGLDITWRVV